MARKSSSTAVQEELYPIPHEDDGYNAPLHGASERRERDREQFDDARLVDLEAEQESPFLRGQKRVSVRRGSIPKKTANRLKWVALAFAILAVLGAVGSVLYSYGKHSWRFRIDSSDQIEVSGSQHVTHAQIMEVMGGDIGRNIFFVPLAQRQQQLEQIPWVESASVMRFVPNRLRIEIHERTPVAFARIGSHISLIDSGGNLMELAPGGKHKYSFPVIAGMNSSEPLSTRAARMKNYSELISQLDSTGAHYSQELSEVDLTDGEDVKVIASDPNGEVLVHLGSGNYLPRYRIFVTHVQAWRQQFTKLDSVDLRYDGQIIVNPDLEGMTHQPALTQAAAKAALAAGAKNAAIVNYEKFVAHPAPPATATKHPDAKSKVVAKPESKADLKPAPKVAPKTVVHHPIPKAKAKVKTASVRTSGGLRASSPVPHKTPASTTTAKSSSSKASSNTANTQPTASALATKAPAVNVATTKTKPAQPGSVNSPSASVGQKKPSPGIPKETPQN